MGPTVQTKYGALRGQERDGVASFLGIPYAASPTGSLRFHAPQPPEPWSGVRDATAFGATPPKPDYPVPFDTLLAEPNIAGDEWLNLNVWTPRPDGAGPSDGAGLPVMVWIHGGAFANGNSAVPMYDGHAFARDGVVLVSINYRLGVDGFALLPGAPANRGMLDQVAALEWVRDNISAFGGDPANVTIFGESAGGMSVTTLLAMPRAAGLFAKAIAQSGAAQAAATPADAAMVTAELGKALAKAGALPAGSADAPGPAGTPDSAGAAACTPDGLAQVELPALIAGQAAVRDALAADPNPVRFGATIVAGSMPFIPVVDGDVLPEHPLAAITAGSGSAVPLLIGTNAEEFRLFLVPPGTINLINDDALPVLASAVGATAEVIATYRANRPDASAGDIFAALLTDRFFWQPALAVAEARAGGPAATYFYEFAWRSPDIGAGHAVEIPFVFDNVATEGAGLALGTGLALGDGAPQDLADQMHAAWVRFASTGDPGWPGFGADRTVRVFDADGGSISHDQRRDEREVWPVA